MLDAAPLLVVPVTPAGWVVGSSDPGSERRLGRGAAASATLDGVVLVAVEPDDPPGCVPAVAPDGGSTAAGSARRADRDAPPSATLDGVVPVAAVPEDPPGCVPAVAPDGGSTAAGSARRAERGASVSVTLHGILLAAAVPDDVPACVASDTPVGWVAEEAVPPGSGRRPDRGACDSGPPGGALAPAVAPAVVAGGTSAAAGSRRRFVRGSWASVAVEDAPALVNALDGSDGCVAGRPAACTLAAGSRRRPDSEPVVTPALVVVTPVAALGCVTTWAGGAELARPPERQPWG
jgi:hypothetical protein